MQTKAIKPTEIDIEAVTGKTCIYSDGSVHSDVGRGACAATISSVKKHDVQTRALQGEQGKKSYRTELEGIYLGTTTAEEVDQSSKAWSYWSNSMAALSQCSKLHLSTKDMTAPENDIILAIRHTLKTHGIKGSFNFVRDHQDDDRKFSTLDNEAKYNLICD